jgi:hypothetical protein
MKRAILATWLLLNTVAWADGTPKIKFDHLVYDFGVTSLVESVTGTFTYQNVGDGVLKLQPAKPSCGCTVAQLHPDTLQPGEKGELVFVLTLGAAAVEQEKIIAVPSNDPETPVVSLHIKVATKTVLRAQPPSVRLGDLQLGGTTNVTLTVRRLDERPLTIAKVESTSDLVSVTPEPDPSDPHAARLHFTVKAEGMPRHLSALAQVHTDDSRGAALSISVYARLLGDIKLEPETLAWSMPDPGTPTEMDEDIILSRTLTVSATRPGQSLKITKLASTIKGLKLTIEPIERNRKYLIEATLPQRLKEPVRGVVSFETNLPSLPKVEVPIEVNVWKN